MPADAKLNRLIDRRDALDETIAGIEEVGIARAAFDGLQEVTNFEIERLQLQRVDLNRRITQRIAWLNKKDPFLMGTRTRRFQVPGRQEQTVAPTPVAPEGPSVPETGLQPSHPVHTGMHYRYAGWSDDAVVTQAELDDAAQFTTDVITVPARVAGGYFFFGVDEDPGYPGSIFLNGNPTNQITNFNEQAATLTREGNTVIIGVSTALLSPTLADRTWTLGYMA